MARGDSSQVEVEITTLQYPLFSHRILTEQLPLDKDCKTGVWFSLPCPHPSGIQSPKEMRTSCRGVTSKGVSYKPFNPSPPRPHMQNASLIS